MHVAENLNFQPLKCSDRFDVGTMLRVIELNVKNPAFD